jgi:hypothetical protein
MKDTLSSDIKSLLDIEQGQITLMSQLIDRIIALEKKVEELDWLSHERNCVDPDHCGKC